MIIQKSNNKTMKKFSIESVGAGQLMLEDCSTDYNSDWKRLDWGKYRAFLSSNFSYLNSHLLPKGYPISVI